VPAALGRPGAIAQAKLKPGGLLISYSGYFNLPQIHTMLGHHLEYLWTAAIYHTGAQNWYRRSKSNRRGNRSHLLQATLTKYWKPFTDMVSGGQSKEHHDWEQSTIEAATIYRHYALPMEPSSIP